MPVLGGGRTDSALGGLCNGPHTKEEAACCQERKYQHLPAGDQGAHFLKGWRWGAVGERMASQAREQVSRPGSEWEGKSSALEKLRHREGQRLPQDTQRSNSLPGPRLPESGRKNQQVAMGRTACVHPSTASEGPALASLARSLEEVDCPAQALRSSGPAGHHLEGPCGPASQAALSTMCPPTHNWHSRPCRQTEHSLEGQPQAEGTGWATLKTCCVQARSTHSCWVPI